MTYKLEAFIEKIKSPIVCIFGDKEVEYADGRELSKEYFDKYWLVESIIAKGDKIILAMRVNEQVNSIDWIGEEAVDKSFF